MPIRRLPKNAKARASRAAGVALLTTLSLPLAAAVFPLPPDDDALVGAPAEVRSSFEDTLLEIARRHGLGYEDIVRANPEVDPWLPGDETPVRLPTRYVLPPAPREGIVLNLPEYRLYYFPPRDGDGDKARVQTHPISIGRMDWATPLGVTRVVAKAANPTWYPPESVRAEHAAEGDPLPRVVPPGPNNPLGKFAMRLAIPGYLIHGTNRPRGVGMRVTHGCVRMYPEDIASLYPKIPVGTPVRIVNEPYKFGWHGDELWLEVHPPLTEDDDEVAAERSLTALIEAYVRATAGSEAEVDWAEMERVQAVADGIPVRVGHRSPAPETLAEVKQTRE